MEKMYKKFFPRNGKLNIKSFYWMKGKSSVSEVVGVIVYVRGFYAQ